MTGPRSYSAATRAALALLSRGRCYNPDCERPDPIIVRRGGEPYIDYEIAHIDDAEPGKPPRGRHDRRRAQGLRRPRQVLVRPLPQTYALLPGASWGHTSSTFDRLGRTGA